MRSSDLSSGVAHRQLPTDVLAELSRHVGDYLLIGAHARDIVCHWIAGVSRAMPRTTDLDIAIAVEDVGHDYLRRVSALEPRGGSRLRYSVPNFPDLPVDVIPFGERLTEVEDIPVDSDRSLDATGIAEASRASIDVTLRPGVRVRVPSIEAQIALKIIAFDLRSQFHEFRDARDLGLLLDATNSGPFLETCYDHISEAPTWVNFDVALIGPWLAGVGIAQAFPDNIRRRITRALDSKLLLPGVLRGDGATSVRAPDETLRRKQIRALVEGINQATPA